MYNSQNTQKSKTGYDLSSLFMRIASRHNTSRASVSARADRITVHQLRELINSDNDLMLVDIRLPWEYQAGHIPRSISIPYFEITEAVEQGLLHGRQVVLYCRVGIRSIRTRNVVRAMGVESVVDLAGGIFAWEETGWDTVTDAADTQETEGFIS